jgi:hypothetical protein
MAGPGVIADTNTTNPSWFEGCGEICFGEGQGAGGFARAFEFRKNNVSWQGWV